MKSRTLWIVVFGGIVAIGLGAAVVTAFVTDSGGSASSTSTRSSVSDTFDLPIGLQKDTLALAEHQRDLLVGLLLSRAGRLKSRSSTATRLWGAMRFESRSTAMTFRPSPAERGVPAYRPPSSRAGRAG